MKKNDSSDFSVLYVEPDDERDALFQVLAGQHKPVVLMLAEQTRVFQRPDDFTLLKLTKRRYNLTIIFVLPNGGPGALLASKNGFPVFSSMDQLADAVQAGHLTRQRALAHPTGPLDKRITAPLGDPHLVTHHEIKAHRLDPMPVDKAEQVNILMEQSQKEPPKEPPKEPQKEPPIYFTNHSLPEQPALKFSTVQGHDEYSDQQYAASDRQYAASNLTLPLALPGQSPGLPQAPQSFTTAPLGEKLAQQRKRRRSLIPTILTLAVILGLIGSFLILPHTFLTTSLASSNVPRAAAAPLVVGHAEYVSSEQVNETSSQGIADEFLVSLQGLQPAATGKQYYAWLLGDRSQSDPITIALGTLAVTQGKAQLLYKGDAQHHNLLLSTSRFLVTEEDASVPPLAPSNDPNAWKYYSEFSSVPIKSPDNPKNFSYLSHLRHLLAADPTLDALALPGGLNAWLYRNTGKLVEWSTSMRETWVDTKDVGFVRRQTTRILTYLDGTTFVYKDLPIRAPLLVDERLARVGLLNVMGPDQQPPSYLDHIDQHLLGLLQADATPQKLRAQVDAFTAAMSNVNQWLKIVHSDAVKIVAMSDAQLRQPGTLTLLNDMIGNINNAFAGQLDPTTGQMREGVSWLHDNMNALATMDISPVKPKTTGLVSQTVAAKTHA